LERIDKGLKKNLDLKMRYQDIDYKLKIVQDNLTLFTDLLQNRESTRLEWIVIILILIEVFDIMIKKFFE
jgi:required for meiotic nuclear division protein 1